MSDLRLENICLNSICLNLYLNYRICKKNSLRIPSRIGQLIFENSFIILLKFDSNDLKFFKKEITDLKSIDLQKKQFKYIEYYDFLNGHNLDLLQIGIIEKFNLKNSKNFHLTSNEIIIKHYGTNSNNTGKLLNYCFIKESITLLLKEDSENFNDFINLIKNCDDSLRILDLQENNLSLIEFEKILKILTTKPNLKNLSIDLLSSNNDYENLNENIKNNLFVNLSENVTDLNIAIDDYLYKNFYNVLDKFKYLNSLALWTLPGDDKMIGKILNLIRINYCNNLQKLELHFEDLSEFSNDCLADNLKYFHKLTNITISSYNVNNCLNWKIFDGLMNSSKTLEDIDISFYEFTNNDDSIDKFLIECSSLNSIDIGMFFSFDVNIDCINIVLNSCKDKLKDLKFHSCYTDEDKIEKLNFPIFKNLYELHICAVYFQNNSMQLFFKSIQNLAINLTSLIIADCGLSLSNIHRLRDFLTLAINLKHIDFRNNNYLGDGIGQLFTYLPSPYRIEYINLVNCGIKDHHLNTILPFFKNFKNLKTLNMAYNRISGLSTIELLSNLKKFNKYLTDLLLYQCVFSKILIEPIKLYTDSIPSIQYFENGKYAQ